jgi:hypothetical protein
LLITSINLANLVDLGVEVEVIIIKPFQSFFLALAIAALILLLLFLKALLTFLLISALEFYPGFYIAFIK